MRLQGRAFIEELWDSPDCVVLCDRAAERAATVGPAGELAARPAQSTSCAKASSTACQGAVPGSSVTHQMSPASAVLCTVHANTWARRAWTPGWATAKS